MKTLRQQVDAGEIKEKLSDEDIELWDNVQKYNQFKAKFSLELLNSYRQMKDFYLNRERRLWFYTEYPKLPKESFIGIENVNNKIHYDFNIKDTGAIKKRKLTTINNKTITYTHCIPSSVNLVKFTLRQRLKILLGIKVNVTINTYLNMGRIETTILKINN